MIRQVALALVLAAGLPGLAAAQSPADSQFDHLTTGFRLDGTHLNADCESCHVGAVFQGTPTECVGCHVTGGRIDQATAKTANHVLSTDFCEDCHRTTEWFPLAEMNHDAIFGSCSSCHNNAQSVGKPPDHPPTQQECESCHLTTGWFPVFFDHSGIESVVGNCSGCHDGVTAVGKQADHLPTTAECDVCHLTNAWIPSSFDHVNVTPGTCAGCHNDTTATGQGSGHFATQLECDYCHTSEFWSPLVFDHQSATYPGDHSVNLDCTDCHATNAEPVPWPFPAYRPDCAGCHASDYRPGPHRNASVSQLRDCAGSCHQSSPEHSVNSREW